MAKDKEMKIGINVGMADREGRGITVYTKEILSEFARLDGYQFVLFHNHQSVPHHRFGITDALLAQLPFSKVENTWFRLINEQLIGPLQQLKLGLDVMWNPHNRSQLITPVGYVTTVHDTLPLSRPDLAGNYLDSWDKKILNSSRVKTASYADKVIAVSNFTRDEIIRNIEIDPKKVVTIHNGVNHEIFKPNNNHEDWKRVKNEYSLPDRYILTTGSYATHKNLKTIVDAYIRSDLSSKDLGLVMVGPNDASGYTRGYYQLCERVNSLGQGEKIRLLTRIPLLDLVALYSNAYTFVIASEYEGFGFAPLEAMACEVPVVASNVTAIPEVCGEAALYSDPHDVDGFASHFVSLYENESLIKDLINKGRIQSRKFTWANTAAESIRVITDVCTSKTRWI